MRGSEGGPHPTVEGRPHDDFEEMIRTKRRRIERARRERDRSFWRHLGLIGVVGWSVSVPALLGALLGRWLDGKYGTDYRFTLGLIVLGLGVGMANAWRSVKREESRE